MVFTGNNKNLKKKRIPIILPSRVAFWLVSVSTSKCVCVYIPSVYPCLVPSGNAHSLMTRIRIIQPLSWYLERNPFSPWLFLKTAEISLVPVCPLSIQTIHSFWATSSSFWDCCPSQRCPKGEGVIYFQTASHGQCKVSWLKRWL